MYKIMTPGPTQVAENVRLARSLECTNPDLDEEFVEFYKETCEKISSLLHTSNETLILSGEGILGLEAAIASMTEPGDKVLVLDNGIYGKGFADFVTMYGGRPELYSRDYQETFDVKELEEFLKNSHDYKYATVVHGDTPSGMLNDISAICPLLKKYGILTVVDSVSASFGEPMNIDDWKVDIMCGGSQKVVSAPPGLTFVVEAMMQRNPWQTVRHQLLLSMPTLQLLHIITKKNGFHIQCRSVISTDSALPLTTSRQILPSSPATQRSPVPPERPSQAQA